MQPTSFVFYTLLKAVQDIYEGTNYIGDELDDALQSDDITKDQYDLY